MMKSLKSMIVMVMLVLMASCSIQQTNYPEETFTFIEKHFNITVCNMIEEVCLNNPDILEGAASGVHVKNKGKHSYILTVAHACGKDLTLPPAPEHIFVKINDQKMIVKDHHGDEHEGKIIAQDDLYDLCLIETDRIPHAPIKIAKRAAKHQETVLNLAAPFGIWEPGNTMLFDGRYIGGRNFVCPEDDDECIPKRMAVYTIPAFPGSSGSPVINNKGELVGIIAQTMQPGYHISFGAPLKEIKRFLKENLG